MSANTGAGRTGEHGRGQRDGSVILNLPIYLSGFHAPGWWAMVFTIMIEAVAFASLFFGYFYLRATVPTWPPSGYSPPDVTAPTIILVLALLSAAAVYLGDAGIAAGERTRLMGGVGVAFVLGIIALILELATIGQLPVDWHADAFGSAMWIIVGAWLLLLIIVLLQCALVLVAGWQSYYTRRRRLGVQMLAVHWYFAVAVWVAVYLVVYISPRVIQG